MKRGSRWWLVMASVARPSMTDGLPRYARNDGISARNDGRSVPTAELLHIDQRERNAELQAQFFPAGVPELF